MLLKTRRIITHSTLTHTFSFSRYNQTHDNYTHTHNHTHNHNYNSKSQQHYYRDVSDATDFREFYSIAMRDPELTRKAANSRFGIIVSFFMVKKYGLKLITFMLKRIYYYIKRCRRYPFTYTDR